MGIVCSFADADGGGVHCVSFAPSAAIVAAGSLDGSVRLWELATQACRWTGKHDDGVTKLLWHPANPLLVSSSLDRKVKVWDARTGERLKILQGHRLPIMDMLMSRDGAYVLTGADDNTALLFRP